MLSRFSSLRYLAAGGASKIVATTRATPASNLLLRKEYGNGSKRPRDEDPGEGPSCPPSKRAKVCEEDDETVEEKPRTVAVLLAGCGKMDGSDVAEAVSLAINLDKHEFIAVDYFAMDQVMPHNWDHQHWASMNRQRNARHEAARLLRTAHIYDLNELTDMKEIYDGLIIPGGRGVGWNLMTLAARRDPTQLNESLRETIQHLVTAKKIIGCSSEGSILAALTLQGVTITFGRQGNPADNQAAWRAQLIQEARSLNALHEERENHEYAYCPTHNVYSVPGHLGHMPSYRARHHSMGSLVWCFRNHWSLLG